MKNTSSGINLIRQHKRKIQTQRTFFAKVQSISVVILGAYTFLLFSIIGIKAATEAKLNTIEKNIVSEEKRINQLATVELRQTILVNKLDLLEDYFSARKMSLEKTRNLLAQIPVGVTPNELIFGEDTSEVSLNAEARSIYQLLPYFSILRSSAVAQDYQNIVIEDIHRDETARYNVESAFELEGKKETAIQKDRK